MPETLEPPKKPAKPFSAALTAALPANAAQEAAAPKPVPEPPPAQPTIPAAKPAPAPAPDADAEILEGKRAPKGEDFKRVKHAATEANKRADELKAAKEAADKELAELRKTPKHNAELIKQIESERDELKAKWQLVAAQFDSGFHAKYEAKIGDAIAKIKDAVPADRLDKISQVLQMPDSEWKRRTIAELTEDLDAPTITDVMIANREIRDILSARKKELEDSGTILKTSAEQRKKEQDERRKTYEQSFESVLKTKSEGEDAFETMKLREGDTPEVKAWNEEVASRSKIARAIFLDEFESPAEKAEAAILSANAPGFLAGWKAAEARAQQLEAELAKVHGAVPKLGAGGGKGQEGEKLTFSQRMAKQALP